MDKTFTALNGTIRVHDDGVDIQVTSRSESLRYDEILKIEYSKAKKKEDGAINIYIMNKKGIRLRFDESKNDEFKEAESNIMRYLKKKKESIEVSEARLPVETINSDILKSYSVLYLGGISQNPKKTYNIDFIIFENRFEINCKNNAMSKFYNVTIMHNNIINFEIVARNVTSFEGLLGGINSRQLNQNNNIYITCLNDNGEERIIRLEMITGVTVMGQAVKCQELMDFLRTNNILSKFKKNREKINNINTKNDLGYLNELEKLSKLKMDGVITQEEFEQKKKQLLGL